MLGSLMFVDILWTSPIHEEQWLRPEDAELAEVCVRKTVLQNFYAKCAG